MSELKPAYDVFVSYSSTDKQWVREDLVPMLRLHGLKVSVDFDFEYGKPRDDEIKKGITSSTHFLAVLSPGWFKSVWCPVELTIAKSMEKVLHPVERHQCPEGSQEIFDHLVFLRLWEAERNSEAICKLLTGLGVAVQDPGHEAWSSVAARYQDLGAPVPAPVARIQLDGVPARDPPMDLGTAWGLSRLGLIGLVAAPESIRVLDVLLRAERVMTDAQLQRLVQRLPDRWWMACSVDSFPNGPLQLADIWQSARTIRLGNGAGDGAVVNQLVERLRQHGEQLPRDLKLGLFIKVNADQPDKVAAARCWLEALSRLLEADRYCLVVQLAAPTMGSCIQAATELAVAAHDVQAPVDVVEWRGAIPLPASEISRGMSSLAALFSAAQARDPDVGRRFKLVAAASGVPSDRLAGSDNVAVVAALDRSNAHPGLDRELLQLVAGWLPEFMDQLLRGYACSTRWQARREAMSACAGRDAWTDALIAAANWADPVWDEVAIFSPSEGRAFVDDILLGLLRAVNRGRRDEDVLAAIASLRHRGSRSVAELSAAALEHRMPKLDRDAGAGDWLDLARSGYNTDRIAEWLPIPSDGPWWLLSAIPPRVDAVKHVLTMSEDDRAVLGIVTDEEHRRLQADPRRMAVVRRRRRGRDL